MGTGWTRWVQIAVFALVIVLLAADGAWAQELEPIKNVTKVVLDTMTGGLALVLCALAIVSVGYLYWTGRLNGEVALAVTIGTGLVFGAVNIAKLLSDAAKLATS